MPDAGTALGDGLQDAVGTLGPLCEGGRTGCRGRNALKGILVLVVVVDAEHAVGAIAVKGYAHKQDKRSRTARHAGACKAERPQIQLQKRWEHKVGETVCQRFQTKALQLVRGDEPIPGLFNVGTMIGDFYSGVYTFAMEGMNYGATCITLPYLLGRDLAAGKFDA